MENWVGKDVPPEIVGYIFSHLNDEERCGSPPPIFLLAQSLLCHHDKSTTGFKLMTDGSIRVPTKVVTLSIASNLILQTCWLQDLLNRDPPVCTLDRDE